MRPKKSLNQKVSELVKYPNACTSLVVISRIKWSGSIQFMWSSHCELITQEISANGFIWKMNKIHDTRRVILKRSNSKSSAVGLVIWTLEGSWSAYQRRRMKSVDKYLASWINWVDWKFILCRWISHHHSNALNLFLSCLALMGRSMIDSIIVKRSISLTDSIGCSYNQRELSNHLNQTQHSPAWESRVVTYPE